MVKNTPSGFDDPLADIDPIMEQAFSINDPEDAPEEEIHFPPPVAVSAAEPAKQSMSNASSQQRQGRKSTVDDYSPSVAHIDFPNLSHEPSHGPRLEEGVFSNIPVKVSVELGRAQLSLKEVYELTEGSIVELDRLVGEPLDLVINGQVLAQGEVVAIDNKYGLRIKSLVSSPQKR